MTDQHGSMLVVVVDEVGAGQGGDSGVVGFIPGMGLSQFAIIEMDINTNRKTHKILP